MLVFIVIVFSLISAELYYCLIPDLVWLWYPGTDELWVVLRILRISLAVDGGGVITGWQWGVLVLDLAVAAVAGHQRGQASTTLSSIIIVRSGVTSINSMVIIMGTKLRPAEAGNAVGVMPNTGGYQLKRRSDFKYRT